MWSALSVMKQVIDRHIFKIIEFDVSLQYTIIIRSAFNRHHFTFRPRTASHNISKVAVAPTQLQHLAAWFDQCSNGCDRRRLSSALDAFDHGVADWPIQECQL